MENIERRNKFREVIELDGDGEPRASSLALAGGMKQNHASVMKLVRRFMPQLEQMGRVRFEVQPFETRGGRQNREVAMLTEQQSMFLVSCMRNNDEVVQFKVDLAVEFCRMRAEIARMKAEAQQRNHDLWQQMQALIAKEVDSQVRASFGSHLMLTRKKEKPQLLTEREMLESAIQPSLLN